MKISKAIEKMETYKKKFGDIEIEFAGADLEYSIY